MNHERNVIFIVATAQRNAPGGGPVSQYPLSCIPASQRWVADMLKNACTNDRSDGQVHVVNTNAILRQQYPFVVVMSVGQWSTGRMINVLNFNANAARAITGTVSYLITMQQTRNQYFKYRVVLLV